jgi:hypothetical protein
VATISIVLVLDKDTATVGRVLTNEHAIVVPVATLAQFRHFAERSFCDVWVCDLSIEGLNFRDDVEILRSRNPNLRVVLTGPASLGPAAHGLVQQRLATTFIPKPWRFLALRQAVFHAPPATGRIPKPVHTATPVKPVALPAETDAGDKSRPAASAAAGIPRKNRQPISAGSGALRLRPLAQAIPKAEPVVKPVLEEPRYRIEELLGEGGVGKVFRAHDLLLDVDVAIKVLSPDFLRDEAVLEALKAEARICMQLSHPHIVRFFDFGHRSGTYYLVMEYVRGQTLHEILQRPNSQRHEFIRAVALAIGSGLKYAHDHGVLHNDIKPGNIMIGADGVLRLIDFGIASAAREWRAKSEYVFGTPAYMSPEQLRSDTALDASTDIFALGVLLHQMLTGLLPQSPDASPEDLAFHPRPPVTALPPPIADVLNRALAFDPKQRWPSVTDFVAAFDAALEA